MNFYAFLVPIIFSGVAFASPGEPFEVIKDGYVYSCTVKDNPNPGGAVDCVEKAYAGPFSKDESIQLCTGAMSVAPAECANLAYAGPYSKPESIQLCTYARSTGPALCARKAYSGPFSKDESVSLCSRNGTEANADCAIRAYAGPYSKEQAIALCKSNADLLNPLLSKLNDESKIGFSKVLDRAVTKAVLRDELN